MATTLDTLLLKLQVDSTGLNSGLTSAETKITTFSDKASKAFAAIAAAAAAAASLGGFVNVITTFEKLEASLRTVTGSSEAASYAFNQLQNFAMTTPFQLEEVVNAFIKMKALGLDPSQEALTSFGNTAIAMGKSLNQMIEAVADAATGEFERLKEFGIRASTQGDSIKFTFQGVTTEVKNSADAIQDYLKQIGDVQFAGAMEQQSNTLNIALSNLADAFDKLIKQIGDSGTTQIFIDIANAITKVTNNITEFVATQEKVGAWFYNITHGVDAATQEIQTFNEELRKAGQAGTQQLAVQQAAPIAPQSTQPTEEDKKKQAQLETDLARFEESLRTKEESENFYYEGRLEKLEEFRNNELITEQEYNQLMLDEYARHTEALNKIEEAGLTDREKFQRMSMSKQAQTIFGELSNITAGVAQHNKTLFEINKVAGIGSAIVNAYIGISKTLATYPFPINIAMAAAHAAAAFAQVTAIKSSTFNGGGGGSAPSLAGSTPAPAVSDVGSSGGRGGGGSNSGLDITLTGFGMNDLFTGAQVNSLIARINEAVEDGAIIRSVRVS